MLTRIGRGIRDLGLPAIEKIAEEQSGTPFHVLIATMLSAQTRDPVTLEASTRLFEARPHAAHDGEALHGGDRAA